MNRAHCSSLVSLLLVLTCALSGCSTTAQNSNQSNQERFTDQLPINRSDSWVFDTNYLSRDRAEQLELVTFDLVDDAPITYFHSVAASVDGYIYAVRSLYSYDSSESMIVKYDSDLNRVAYLRSSDTPYDAFGIRIAVAPDGSIFVAYFINNGSDTGIIKYDTDFVEIASTETRFGYTVLVASEDGSLYAAGWHPQDEDYYLSIGVIIKYNSDLNEVCSLVWDNDKRDEFFDLAVAPDGSVYALGSSILYQQSPFEAYLFKYNSNLVLQGEFVKSESDSMNQFSSLAVDANGSIFIVWDTNDYWYGSRSFLLKLDSNLDEVASLDTNEIRSDFFSRSEFDSGMDIRALAVDPEGYIYAAGQAGTATRRGDAAIVLLDNDLRIANIVAWPRENRTESFHDIAISADGIVYAAGESHPFGEGFDENGSNSDALIIR
ncbi:MAG: hypothetical protein FWD45_06880 [Coriobacteriia bacterium]|nr:hypothetical protein [Coriobacteriia bacterium]